MKRFEFKVILHIIVIFLLSISSCLLYQRQLWFSTTVCILLLIASAYISTEYSSNKSPYYGN